MILVTGATGSNGVELARALSARNVRFRALVRSQTSAAKLKDIPGIDFAVGDFDDPPSIDEALKGIDKAYLLTNSTERAEEQQLAFVRAAVRAGVAQIVKLSQFAASMDSPVRFLRYHAAVENAIIGAGLTFTFLRPNLYMQALLAFAPSIAAEGKFYAPAGDARVSLVDVRDNAAVAAAALTEAGHEGRIYDLTGPEALTHAEIATCIGEAIGKPVEFVNLPPAAMRDALLGMKMPEWQADGLIEDYAHYRRGEASVVATGVRDATGSSPRDFRSFAGDYAGVLGGGAAAV